MTFFSCPLVHHVYTHHSSLSILKSFFHSLFGFMVIFFIYCHFVFNAQSKRILDHKIDGIFFCICILCVGSFFLSFDAVLQFAGIITRARICMNSCIICLNICFWRVRCFSALWFTWFICVLRFFFWNSPDTFSEWDRKPKIANFKPLIRKLLPIFILIRMNVFCVSVSFDLFFPNKSNPYYLGTILGNIDCVCHKREDCFFFGWLYCNDISFMDQLHFSTQ